MPRIKPHSFEIPERFNFFPKFFKNDNESDFLFILFRKLDGMIIAQKNALAMLQKLDTDLYRKALEIDTTLTPFKAQGPTCTPPIPDYYIDGEYENITKKYEIVYADTESYLRQLTARRKRAKKKVVEDED